MALDEMLPRSIAEQLRGRGRDVVAVTESPELRGRDDHEQFMRSQAEERALVTYDTDYLEIARDWTSEGHPHAGLVMLSSARFPQRSAATIGRLVTALDDLLGEPPPYQSFVHWLG